MFAMLVQGLIGNWDLLHMWVKQVYDIKLYVASTTIVFFVKYNNNDMEDSSSARDLKLDLKNYPLKQTKA